MQIGIREKTAFIVLSIMLILTAVFVMGSQITENDYAVALDAIFKAPSKAHLFGTDWMGRDMLARTLKGLSLSMKIGFFCTLSSGLIALVMGVFLPMMGKKADFFVGWLIDLALSVPHTLVVILVAIAMGGGAKGIWLGITLTHWTGLTRVIRAEVKQLNTMPYTKISRKLGKSKSYVARKHILPHVLPQLFVGMILVFPHAILHEAAVTFLGFGLPPHEPAIGVILSEAMKYLTTGKWWLAFFPGLSLVALSLMVDGMCTHIKKWISPETAYE
ncbi:ABC transporter permease [Fusibacter sp. JL298sf-3]